MHGLTGVGLVGSVSACKRPRGCPRILAATGPLSGTMPDHGNSGENRPKPALAGKFGLSEQVLRAIPRAPANMAQNRAGFS